MKVKVTAILMIALFAVSASAGTGLKLSAVTGYSMTAFEDQDDAAGTLPIGVQVGKQLKPALEVGVEVIFPLGGYTFEAEEMGLKLTSTFNQSLIGAYGKYSFGEGRLKPYAKAGVGYYSGNADLELEVLGESASEEVEIESAVGFSVGVGVACSKSGLFGEFVYNLVTREDMGMNTWAVLIGYQILK